MNKREQLIKGLKEIKDTIYVTYTNAVDTITTKKINFDETINNLEKNTREVIGLKDILSNISPANYISHNYSVPNSILGGYQTAEIKAKNGVNYLELTYLDGKAKVTCERIDTKAFFPVYKYKINRIYNGQNGLASYIYDNHCNRVDYHVFLRNDEGISNINGQIKSKRYEMIYADGKTKAYSYDSLSVIKPLFDFKSENMAVIANVVENFRPQYLPTYEDTFVSEVVNDKVHFKYNGLDQTDLNSFISREGMRSALDSYISGELRPANALTKKRK